MALITADRVKDSTVTTGTGSITLSGTAPTGFRTFASVMATNDTCYYAISSPGGAEWEVGLGTLTASTTLARTAILASSNAGSVVSLSAGTKDVYITIPAAAGFAPWTAYTPTLSQSGATVAYGAARAGAYSQSGNTVKGRFILPLTTGTSGGTSSTVLIQASMLPTPKSSAANTVVGYFQATNGTTTNFAGTLLWNSSTDWLGICTGSGAAFGNIPSFPLTSTCVVSGFFEYEAL